MVNHHPSEALDMNASRPDDLELSFSTKQLDELLQRVTITLIQKHVAILYFFFAAVFHPLRYA